MINHVLLYQIHITQNFILLLLLANFFIYFPKCWTNIKEHASSVKGLHHIPNLELKKFNIKSRSTVLVLRHTCWGVEVCPQNRPRRKVSRRGFLHEHVPQSHLSQSKLNKQYLVIFGGDQKLLKMFIKLLLQILGLSWHFPAMTLM